MKKFKTKYLQLVNISALVGYLSLVFFSGFHHHVKFVPVSKTESRINLPQSFINIDDGDCEVCYIVNSSNISFHKHNSIPVDNSKLIISCSSSSTIVYGFKGTVKDLRAPPVIIS